MDGSYYQIIARTLAGERPVDEQTDASVAILAERMERLRSHGGLLVAGPNNSGRNRHMERTLNDKHRAEFRASGINDETIVAAGVYSTDGNVIRMCSIFCTKMANP